MYYETSFPELLKAIGSFITVLGKNLPRVINYLGKRRQDEARYFLTKVIAAFVRLAHYELPLLILEFERFYERSKFFVETEEAAHGPIWIPPDRGPRESWYEVQIAAAKLQRIIDNIVTQLGPDNLKNLITTGLILENDVYEALCACELMDAQAIHALSYIGVSEEPFSQADGERLLTSLRQMQSQLNRTIPILRRFLSGKGKRTPIEQEMAIAKPTKKPKIESTKGELRAGSQSKQRRSKRTNA